MAEKEQIYVFYALEKSVIVKRLGEITIRFLEYSELEAKKKERDYVSDSMMHCSSV